MNKKTRVAIMPRVEILRYSLKIRCQTVVLTSEDTAADDDVHPHREVAGIGGIYAASSVRQAVVATALFVRITGCPDSPLLYADGCIGVAVKANLAVIAAGIQLIKG